MESRAGSILTLIAAIINFIAAGILAIIAIAAPIIINTGVGEISGDISRATLSIIAFVIILLIALVVFIIGFLLLRSSKKMKDPKTTKNGAIWAIVLGAITIGQISGILALIGGILGVVDANKPTPKGRKK